ncbi:dihydrodipicolinate synthase family protein [Niveibacterium sp. SC-1]|uniref:dihydrodipicolinate synthase family protein n=1 Tax=Niveibacterium sp. SC-1 TaxID=3135646 RepID=UPI00311D7F6B
MHTFSGIWIPLVTPFDTQGAIDFKALRGLVRLYAPVVQGLVVCGSTGEAQAMNPSERLAVLDAVLEAVAASGYGTPVAMGVGGSHVPSMLEDIGALRTRPLAGVLVPPPSYARPAQAGILQFYRDVVACCAQPVVVYTIPYRTGVAIESETFAALADIPGIVAVKDCGGSSTLTTDLIQQTSLRILAGEDAQLFGSLCLGGAGGIVAAAHFVPERFVALWRAIEAGRLAEAREGFRALLPLIRLLFSEPNPAPIKGLLAQQGLCGANLRAPHVAASSQLVSRLLEVLAELDPRTAFI